MMLVHRLLILFVCTLASPIFSVVYTMQPGSDLVGRIQYHQVSAKDTWFSIAYQYDVGHHELRIANPKVYSLKKHLGKILIIPTQYILPPKSLRKGIVVNLAEKRLYFFASSTVLFTYPVGVGRDGWQSPSFKGRVIGKTTGPTWYVPKSILAYYKKKYGKDHPKTVPPGPNNPLGNYLIRTSMPRILIHGTSDDTSVGKNISSGCIRMYNRNISELFHLVPARTSIAFVHQDEKIGIKNNTIYYEKSSMYRHNESKNVWEFIHALQAKGYHVYTDRDLIARIYEQGLSIPHSIGSIAPKHAYGQPLSEEETQRLVALDLETLILAFMQQR